MRKNVINTWSLATLLLVFSIAHAGAADEASRSFHAGVLHPNGIDLFGYSVERNMDNKLFWCTRFEYRQSWPSVSLSTVIVLGLD